MATVTNVLNYARAKAQTDSNGLTDTSGLLFVNDALQDFRLELVKKGVDAASVIEAYRNASVPSSGNPSTFLYPTDLLFLKTIDVNSTDTNQQNYVTATQIDVSNTPNNTSFDWFRINQPASQPLFDDRGSYYEIFPTFTSSMNLTKAIKLVYFQQPTPYSTVSDSLQYPESLDYYILSIKVVSLYFESLDKFNEADVWDKRYQVRLNRLIETLSRGSQTPTQTKGITLTGYEF